MDPKANLAQQRDLSNEASDIRDSCADDGRYTQEQATRLNEIATELAELVIALDEWRTGGGFDPYPANEGPGTITPLDMIVEAAELDGSENPEYNRALIELVNRCLGRSADDLDQTEREITAQARIIDPRDEAREQNDKVADRQTVSDLLKSQDFGQWIEEELMPDE